MVWQSGKRLKKQKQEPEQHCDNNYVKDHRPVEGNFYPCPGPQPALQSVVSIAHALNRQVAILNSALPNESQLAS